MKTMLLKGWIEAPIDLDDEVWDNLLRKINKVCAKHVNKFVTVNISELGERKNRPNVDDVLRGCRDNEHSALRA